MSISYQKIDPFIHLWQTDQKFFGMEIGARMTVIDIDGRGSLWVHSPIQITPQIKKQIDEIGEVKFVVAPNKWHHMYIGDFQKAYPQAEFFCAPGLEKKRKDFKFSGIIDDQSDYPWRPLIDHLFIEGAPMFSEVAFFHPKSRTLILTDTALHICKSSPLKTKLIFMMMGAFEKFGLSAIEKWAFIKDSKAFSTSMETVGRWDFDRIILAHGEIIEAGGKEKFQKAYL